MTHKIESDTDINALVVTTFGEASIAGFRSYIEETLTDPRWTPGMNVLGDYTRLDTSSLSSKDMQQLAAIHIAHDERMGSGFHAIATGQLATFGLARMSEGLHPTGRLALHTRVFLTVEEARAWLREVTGTSAVEIAPSANHASALIDRAAPRMTHAPLACSVRGCGQPLTRGERDVGPAPPATPTTSREAAT